MLRLQKNPRNAIVPIAGDRVFSRLINAVQSHYVDLTVTATVQISVANATAVRNRGSVMALFDEIGIDENGTDRWLMRGNVARVFTEMAAIKSPQTVRLTSPNIGTTNLRETVRLYFAHPYAANPRETAFLEHDTRQLLQVFVKLAASGGVDRLVTIGGATVAITNLKVTVQHEYDAQETDRPYFIPIVRQIVTPVTGTQANQQVFIKTSNALRALVISQEDTVLGEVTDIINALAFRGDFRDLIGPLAHPWKDLVDESQILFGGDMTSYAHLGMNFQRHGRLASVLNPNQDNNLRFEFDDQISATGTGTSQIRITTVELLHDPALCKALNVPV